MLLNTIKTLTTGELQRAFNWEFILPQIDSAPDNIEISSYIQDVKFGTYNVEDIYSQRLGAFKTYAAGPLNIDSVSLTLLSPTDGSVIVYFQKWKELIVSTRGAFFYPKSKYVKTAYCYLYDRPGNSKVQYKLVNCFPKTFPMHDLSYSKNDFVRFNIELVVDTVEIV